MNQHIEINVDEEKNENDKPHFGRYIKIDDDNKQLEWDVSAENVIKKLIDKAKGYKYLYNETANHYLYMNNLIRIPLMILSWMTVALQTLFTTLSGVSSDFNANYFNITIMLLTFVTSSLVSAQSQFNPYSKYTLCKKRMKQFSEYYQELDMILTFPRHIRSNPFVIISNAQNEYSKLTKSEEDIVIPAKILHKYVDKYKDKYDLVEIVSEFDDFGVNADHSKKALERNKIAKTFVDVMNEMRAEETSRRQSMFPWASKESNKILVPQKDPDP